MLCELVILVNLSTDPWNKDDDKNKDVASKRCAVKYEDAPCLKKFVKVEPLMYRAICGEEKK
jgi:hypothetical protein